MSTITRRAVTFTAPRAVEVVEEPLRGPDPDEVLVQTTLSAISPGTETLIYRGEAPSRISADANIEALSGTLDFPIQYGYAVVGRVTEVGSEVDASWKGRRVFSFQPHVSHFSATPEELIPLRDDTSFRDGVMIPSLETAVNLLMDARPMIGERAAVFGQGVIGLLTTTLCTRYPLESLVTVDPNPSRRALSKERGATHTFHPEQDQNQLREVFNVDGENAAEAGPSKYEGADLILEVSGRPSALEDALSLVGFDGRIIVGSWYGTKKVGLSLGRRFHRSRIEIASSQVSTIDPDHRGRWSKERRMRCVSNMIEESQPGELISDVFSPQDAPEVYNQLDRDRPGILQPVFSYE